MNKNINKKSIRLGIYLRLVTLSSHVFNPFITLYGSSLLPPFSFPFRCGSQGMMECDPKECKAEPMLRKILSSKYVG